MMIFNNKNYKFKNNNLYLIISVLVILVILLNNRDYIEKNMNKEKNRELESFANNNNNKNTKIKELKDEVAKLKKTNKDITNTYFKLRKQEQKSLSKQYDLAGKQLKKQLKKKYENLVVCEEQDSIQKLQKQQEIENEKATRDRVQTDDNKINKMNEVVNNYLEYQKNKGPEVNLLNIGKDIENGIFKLTDNFDSNKKSIIDIFSGKFKSDNNVEGFINKRKQKPKKLKNKMNDKKLIKEGFVVSEEENVVEEENNDKELKEKFFKTKNNKGDKDVDEETEKSEVDEDLLSYFTYVFENIYSLFKKYFNLYINKNKLFNLGNISKDSNTLIGGGMLFIIISMGLYFIDISS